MQPQPQLKTGTASDYATPMVFAIKGKVVVGLDEPVMTVVTLTDVLSGQSQSAQSFSNGTFRFNTVILGTYRLTVVDPKFNLYDRQLLLREPGDTAPEITVRLVRHGDSASAGPPELDASLYTVDAETVKNTPAKAMDEYNKGVSALRNPAKNNPADAHFKKAIESAPNFYEAYLQLGLEQRRQKNASDAIRSFEQASTIKPAEIRPLSLLGEIYVEAQKFDSAVEVLLKAQKTGKMSPRDHHNLGSAYYRLDKYDPAEQELLAAINQGNDADPDPFLQLHNVFMKKKEAGRGLAVLEDYLKLFPNDRNHAAMAERAKMLRQALKLPPPLD
jgi:cytochrome c-type biogenesis protein CcmH/NrfG